MNSTDSGTIVAYVAFATSVIAIALKYINHKRCRSRCNKEEVVYSLDVENTSPKDHQSASCNLLEKPLLLESSTTNKN